MIGEKIRKNNVIIALNVCMLKKKKYILLMFQNITQIMKIKSFFNDSKRKKIHYLAVKQIPALLRGIT